MYGVKHIYVASPAPAAKVTKVKAPVSVPEPEPVAPAVPTAQFEEVAVSLADGGKGMEFDKQLHITKIKKGCSADKSDDVEIGYTFASVSGTDVVGKWRTPLT